MVVVVGHALICDVGSFVLGRYTTVTWMLGIPIVIVGGLVVTSILEKPWRKGECHADPNAKGVRK